ncbi:uncharacterized protein ACLA_045780 [Aspergillus clavatus NRRL 1]|uniref:Amine oxidase domain-containing protein n=1 Tax=Aspergillus clavatus (strain ATCC 1007 / CBS 513.65 / DSM 816 / NCTC 3887 / NRRL 1 / QM 1276 / 107) TaxID=344612 RepID=A1CGV8_ASPCL|nr:uncharacterized protein ACLA_045780 [Aspergillus clavatus NRRL 1]EAW10113.1 conserved hypothetical protein [Aspergillus clavatus NRRL 1]
MKEDRRHVAVVGTGMAGLVTAYLLHHDPQQRYRVRLMDKRDQVSLSAESVAVPSSQPGEKKSVWADVPMRAFAGGFYENLGRMYDYLGVRYHPQPFLFGFSRLASRPQQHEEAPYMVHASNFHQLGPLLPRRGDFFQWALEAALVLLCYLWFTVCCFFVAPTEDESFGHYLRRIYLPRHYNANYLLPLMSSVCTCSHAELLRFPAADVLGYKQRTHRQPHYVVTDGVHKAQETLLRGLDVRLGVHSTRVTPTANRVELTYRLADSDADKTEVFDLVVLAVSPDIVASVFEPLTSSLRDVPTTTVTTVAHTDYAALSRIGLDGSKPGGGISSRPGSPQHIYLRSNGSSTEAVHAQPNSILVTTNPLTPIDQSKIIRSASFTRVLRSPQSRRLINRIFDDGRADATAIGSWRNGDGGVYLAGGWCWDGMVLLEGCIVSAMRVASDLGVEVPWAP